MGIGTDNVDFYKKKLEQLLKEIASNKIQIEIKPNKINLISKTKLPFIKMEIVEKAIINLEEI